MNPTEEFLSLLVSPDTGKQLILDQTDQQLKTLNGSERFFLKGGIPILHHHLLKNEGFDYAKHYELDAAAFPYDDSFDNSFEKAEVMRLRQNILSKIPTGAKWILDAGCGSGWLAGKLTDKDRKVISMDIALANPQKAIQRFPSKNHFALVADALAMPLKENSMDCIIASEIIEHLVDPGKFLECLFMMLKPGGVIIVTTPNNEKILYSLCIHCNQLTPQNAHLHSINKESVKKFLPKEGSSVTSIFNSKILAMLGIQKLFSFIPWSIWKFADQLAIAISGKKAFRLMVSIKK